MVFGLLMKVALNSTLGVAPAEPEAVEQPDDATSDDEDAEVRHVRVDGHTHTPDELFRLGGSAQVLDEGEHTGAKPGRVVRGPGWTGRPRPSN